MSRKNGYWAFSFALVLSALFFFWWFYRRFENGTSPEIIKRRGTRLHIAEPLAKTLILSPGVEEFPQVKEPPKDKLPQADDLKRIKGIGPKISGELQAAGITTFAQLAANTPDALQQILKEASVRATSPATWPEQANLAAAKKWDELKALQSEQGGRRV